MRKQTVMRGILQGVNSNAVSALLLHLLEHARATLIAEGKLLNSSIYVPAKTCVQVLEEASHLRLHRSQILAIVSWADCYDRTGMLLDYRRFAQHAASVIGQLHDPEVQEQRAKVLGMLQLSSKGEGNAVSNIALLNGLSEEDMDSYYVAAFTRAQNAQGEVGQSVFMEIVKCTPLIKFSERDANTITAAFPHSANGSVHWREFVPWAHSSLKALCLERLIQRRIALLGVHGEIDRDTMNEPSSSFSSLSSMSPEGSSSSSSSSSSRSSTPKGQRAGKGACASSSTQKNSSSSSSSSSNNSNNSNKDSGGITEQQTDQEKKRKREALQALVNLAEKVRLWWC